VFKSYPVETLSSPPVIRKLQIATPIGSLSRSVELLTVDIEHEKARAGVRYLSDPTYPVLARSLRTRRITLGPPLPCWRTFGRQKPAHSIRRSARWRR
jgi:hypothetical protein